MNIGRSTRNTTPWFRIRTIVLDEQNELATREKGKVLVPHVHGYTVLVAAVPAA